MQWSQTEWKITAGKSSSLKNKEFEEDRTAQSQPFRRRFVHKGAQCSLKSDDQKEEQVKATSEDEAGRRDRRLDDSVPQQK